MPPPFTHTPAVAPEAEAGAWFFCLRHPVENGSICIVMVGELDVATADRARDVIRRAQDDAAEVICDLGDVSFIDVCGMRVLLDASAHAGHTGARLILVHTPGFVSRALTALGLESELELDSRLPPVPHLGPADCAPADRRTRRRPARARQRG